MSTPPVIASGADSPAADWMNFNEKIRVRRCFAESIRRDKNPKPTVVGFARTCVGRFRVVVEAISPTQSTRYPIYFLKFMKSAANVGGNRLKTDWKRTCFSGFPPALAPELHSGAIMQGRIIASNACLSAPELSLLDVLETR